MITLAVPVLLAGCSTVYYPQPTPGITQGGGVYHVVKSGQTLWRIAQAYNVDIDRIAAANNIRNSSAIKEGHRLFIPGAEKVLKVDAVEPDLRANEFKWPIKGRVIGFFNAAKTDIWSKGIQISVDSAEPVLVSRSGKVVFSDELEGYGSTVIIDHQDGFLSVYANNSQSSVSLGQMVNKGDMIANAQIGRNRFLYFEIRRRGKAVNPLFYLPKF